MFLTPDDIDRQRTLVIVLTLTLRRNLLSSEFSASLYVGEVVPESELVVRQTGAPLGVKSRLAAEVAAPPLALSPDGCKGKKSRIARQGKPR